MTQPHGDFGAMLQRHRAAAGLSQEELAERAGVSRRGISDLERGVHQAPYPATVRRLAEALGLTLEQRAALTSAAHRALAGTAGQPTHALGQAQASLDLSLATHDLTSFVGREPHVAELRRLLSSTRLLTLTGSGGVGKTRLALAVARERLIDAPAAEAFAAFVDLGPIADPDLVPQTVATKLGVPEQPGRPVRVTLVEALQRRAGLLVLDNCEHLVHAGASLIHELLIACPELRVLATSREPLLIDGERVWRVPSLAVPEPGLRFEQIALSAAVRLFVERARAVAASVRLTEQNASAVADLCRRLDGIPLALELAAARVAMLSVEQIAARLDDALGLLVAGRRLAPARQQTVRATLDWSYDLLTEPEQILLERLSVFAGGWMLEAAEAVARGDGLAAQDVLTLLGRLVDTSMVWIDPTSARHVRYRLLETVRQYGRERLDARGPRDAMYHRQAAFFLALAEATEPEIYTARVLEAQARLEADHDNLRAALGWLLDQADADGVQRLAGALARFWFFRGHLAEADTWLNRALALPSGDRPTPGRAKCLFGASLLAVGRAQFAVVERLAQEASELWRGLGNPTEEAFCLNHLGIATTALGKYALARTYLETSLAVSRAAGHGGAESHCLFLLARLAADLQDDDAARGWAEAAFSRGIESGQARQVADAHSVLGVLALRRGDYARASESLETSLAMWRELGRWRSIDILVRLGELAIEQGQLGSARTRLLESLLVADELGDHFATARVLEGFVQLAAAEGRALLAFQLAGAAESIRAALSTPLPPAERSRLDRYLGKARAVLGNQRAEAATGEGSALPRRQAINMAAGTAPGLGTSSA